MKKLLTFVMVPALLFTLGAGVLRAEETKKKPRLYVKFSGLASLAKGGDYGDFVDRREAIYLDSTANPDFTYTVDKQPMFRGFGGEIGVEVKRHAVGISVGFIERTFSVDYQNTNTVTGVVENSLWEHSFKAIPIFLFVHYKVVDSRFIKAFLTVGEGVYLGTYRDDRAVTFQNAGLTFQNSYVEAKRNQLGFHAGLTIDLNISRNFAVSIDAGYRLVKFEKFKATGFYEDDNFTGEIEEGELYYAVNNVTDDAEFRLDASDPERPLWDELPAVFNLNGFSLSVGLKIIL